MVAAADHARERAESIHAAEEAVDAAEARIPVLRDYLADAAYAEYFTSGEACDAARIKTNAAAHALELGYRALEDAHAARGDS